MTSPYKLPADFRLDPSVSYEDCLRIDREIRRGILESAEDTPGEAYTRKLLIDQAAALKAAGYGSDISAEWP